jgi:hypothetical protein
MTVLRDDVRLLIRRMFFTERLTIDAIAERLGFAARTVRRALVIDGGVPASPQPGPYHREDEEDDRHSAQ